MVLTVQIYKTICSHICSKIMLKGFKGSQHQSFRDFLQHSRSNPYSFMFYNSSYYIFFPFIQVSIYTILNVEGFSKKARYIKGFRPFNIHPR